MNASQKEKILKAGAIAKQAKEYAKSIVKPNVLLLDIAEKIETKIFELGGKPAFPTNLSINDIAAHYTPLHNDETKAHGLIKVDLGVHVDGYIADTAFSLDLENSEENKKLIKAAEKALKNASEKMKIGVTLGQVGKAVQEAIESEKFSPLTNLCGHEMKSYELHAGLTIPNIDNKDLDIIGEGLYAVEPFATNGNGKVVEGKLSGIYLLVDDKNVRSIEARNILSFIIEEYKTLPFCSRWIVKRFGTKALFALRQLEENGNIHNYAQLVEISHSKVSQAENTFLVENKTIVTTE
jgi:methionyl aminopeptidase